MQRLWLIFLLSSVLDAAGYHGLPIRFEPSNGGYTARTASGAYYLTSSGNLRLSPQLEMRLADRLRSRGAEPSDRLPGYSNDLRGDDPARWRTGIPQYGQIRYAQVYRGIDLVFHGDGLQLEYDFEVAPGASPDGIGVEFHGAQSVRLGPGGDLMVHAPGEDFRFHPPRFLQGGIPIRGGYRLLGGKRVGFRVGRYDRSRPLLIDPVLGYAALFGSQGSDPIQGLALDAAGNLYVAGTTLSDIPLVNPENPTPATGNCSPYPTKVFFRCQDVFVAKLDPTGTKLLYSTYLGGAASNFAAGIAVDAAGNAYVTGTTKVPNMIPPPGGQAWVIKLNPSGSALLYRGNLGGTTAANAIAVDSSGNAYVAGTSLALDFPAVNALQATPPVRSLLVTNDSGATWRPLNNNLRALTVYSLAIDPTQPATLYAATSSGLYKSLNGGTSWTQLFTAAQSASQVVLDPKTPSTLYALYTDSAANGQIAKSADAGVTWQVLTNALPPPSFPAPVRQFGALALDPAQTSTVWLSGFANQIPSIYKSVDGGTTWSDVHDFPVFFIAGQGDSLTGGAILVDPTNSARIYACCANVLGAAASNVFRTDDGGKTWIEGGRGPTAGSSGIWPPVLDPRDGSILYAPWWGGLVRSGDAGQTWTPVQLPAGAATTGYNSGGLAIAPSGGLYLVNDSGVLYRSVDGGSSWTAAQGPWSPGERILALDPANPSSTIYVGSPGSSAFIEHAFAAKLDSTGAILWATLIAGSQQDEAHAIAVDRAGNAYVAGTTNSLDFPLANPLQGVRGKGVGNGFDAFLTKISSDGSKLLYSTYLGGSGDDAANAVAVDAAGNAYLAGSTDWNDFPTVNAIQAVPGNTYGASFVAQVDATGGKLLFSTYLSGTGGWPFNDAASSIALDAQAGIWVAGHTGAVGFPLARPMESSIGPAGLAYLTNLVPAAKGFALDFSTYFGGGYDDSIAALAIGPTGSVWMAGTAVSPDFLAGMGGLLSSGFLARLDLEPLPPATPGLPLIRAVYNAASMRLGDVIAPGEIVSIFGAELSPAAQAAAAFPLPVSLQGVSVTVGGEAAPLLYVSPGQINFQVPFDVAQAATAILVTRGSQSSAARPVGVILSSPGIFTAAGDGFNSPIIVHTSDYSLVTAQNPAHVGEYVAIFCTGLGAPTASIRAGDAAPAVPVPIQQPIEVVLDSGGLDAVPFAGLAPGYAGLYQVNFQVFGDATPGAKLLYLSIGGVASNQVPLYVQ